VNRHRPAFITITCAVVADVLCGLFYAAAEHIDTAHAMYCAVGNAVTEGACTTPVTGAGHWIDLAEFLLVVPLFAATFSLFTAGLGAIHLGKAETRLADHVVTVRDNLHEALNERMTALHGRVDELQAQFGNGLLNEFQVHLEHLAAGLHERLDSLEPNVQPATQEDPANGCER
jgi:hypothetical protein